MARYCFYCGKELAPGEKCHCREHAYAADARDGSAGPESGGSAGNIREDSGEKKNPENFRAESGGSFAQKAQAAGAGNGWRNGGPAEQVGTDAASGSARERRRAAREARRTERAWAKSERKRADSSYTGYVRREHQSYRTTPGQSRMTAARIMRFFAVPADVLQESLSPAWSHAHTLWLVLALALSGLHYVNLDRRLSLLLGAQYAQASAGRYLLAWVTGCVFVFGILALYTLTLWLISRFLFRQGNLPFLHAFAAGKSAWQYLVLFLALALPSTFTAGNLYGIVLALIGLVFAVILHARMVASLTRLDENRTMQLTVLSVIVFSGLFSTVTIFFQMVNPV